jgi:hypothetical protein
VVAQLLSEGANVNALNYHRRTCLHLASMRGHFHTAELLVQRGAHIERQDASGLLPISYACLGNHVSIAHYLITHNSEVPGACLDAALDKSLFPLALLLIQSGVDLAPLHRTPTLLDDATRGPEVLWLQDCLSGPPPLAHCCRLVVRRCMSRRYFQRHVTRLPLPKPLQRYVTMVELAGGAPSEPTRTPSPT